MVYLNKYHKITLSDRYTVLRHLGIKILNTLDVENYHDSSNIQL